MRLSFLAGLLVPTAALRTTSIVAASLARFPSSTGAAAAALPSASPAPSANLWDYLRSWLFDPTESSEPEKMYLGQDKLLDSVVVEYEFENLEHFEAFRDAATLLFVDIWFLDEGRAIVRLSKPQLDNFNRILPADLRDSMSVVLSDVHRSVIKTFPLHSVELPAHDFANISEILRFLSTLSYTDLGHSYEGRPIRVVRPPAEEPDTLIICGLHGREWASVSACLELADTVKHSAVIPLANPDGYEYSWTTDRLWTKNRQPTALSFCTGHNLARGLTENYDESATQCAESYCGDAAEIEAISKYAKKFKRIVTVHELAQGHKPETTATQRAGQEFINIAMPDYGAGYLVSRQHLPVFKAQIFSAIHDALT